MQDMSDYQITEKDVEATVNYLRIFHPENANREFAVEMLEYLKASYKIWRMTMSRPIHEIARDIRRDWPRPYFGAVPYLNALVLLDRITDAYGADSGRSIVLYFLSNAATWKGETARRIKAELKSILKANQ